jgi:nitroreductase
MSTDENSCPPTEVTRVLRRVRQTRDYRPDPVPEDVLRDILDVARWTGSVSNTQPWTFIVVTDPETKRQMAKAAPYTAHIGIAPVVVCVAREVKGLEIDNFDEGRLAERVMMAAQAHGLSSGLARARAEAQPIVGRLLGVPDGMVLRTMVSIGYATDVGAKPKSPRGEARRPLDSFIRHERYG